MGGKESSRGYLYQAVASSLEALCEDGWDRIYIEYDSENDKVDIVLKQDDVIFKSIQVKSTINTFNKNSLQRWLTDLINDDVGATTFELFLIGQCDKDAIAFINAVEKLQNNKLDKTAAKSIENFDTSIIIGKSINFKQYPIRMEDLEKLLIASLVKFISYNHKPLLYEQIRFIASSIITDQMISSTHGNGISRDEFQKDMEEKIFMLADEYEIPRISIGIKSFSRGAETLEEKTESCLSLVSNFDGRFLKDDLDWNKDIYHEVEKFLCENINKEKAYQIFLDTHSAVAFSAGRVMDTKFGANIFPVQKTSNGLKLWDIKMKQKEAYSTWSFTPEWINEECIDTALVINVTRNIRNDVIEYIKEFNIPIGRILNLELNESGATNFSIIDGGHASTLANSAYEAIKIRSLKERQANLHIFAAAPNAFMFFLGQNSHGFGKCILYDYDFKQENTCTYIQTIKFR